MREGMKKKKIWDNGINNCDLFRKKKVLILVPHEDDEIITVGTILPILNENECDISIAFATNGDYHGSDMATVRMNESLQYCRKMQIKEENIFFMGFGDYGENLQHWYNESKCVPSPAGVSETYATSGLKTYSYLKFGEESEYTRENYGKILKNILLECKADIIFCIDCDIHCDHIALSLMFEEVISEIIREEQYMPLVFKMFAHDILWMGMQDFYTLNLKSCKSIAQNPHHTYADRFFETYYSWEQRVRFPIFNEYFSHYAFQNPYRELMKIYKSQYVKYHFPRLLNSDQVFWLRRTDNLLLKSKVMASSGNAECFQTLKMFECKDVCKKTNLLEDGQIVWKPADTDNEKTISIEFESKSKFQEIVFYTGLLCENIMDIEIRTDAGMVIHTGSVAGNGKAFYLKINELVDCCKVDIRFYGERIEISKIEILPFRKRECEYVKIMKDENFIYQYIAYSQENVKLSLYCFDGIQGGKIQSEDFQWYELVNGEKKLISSDVCLEKGSKRKIIRVEKKDNPAIYDQVEIIVYSKLHIFFVKYIKRIGYYYNKLIYKLVRMINRRR